MPHRSRSSILEVQKGMLLLDFGDSIVDPYYHGYQTDTICDQTGMFKLNTNLIANYGFESDVSGYVTPNSWGAITRSTAQAKSGAASMRIAPLAAGVTNSWAIVSPEGDASALRMGMQSGRTYTFALDVFVPTGTTGNIFLSIYENDGTGTVSVNSSVAVANSTWQRITVSKTLRPYAGGAAAEAYCRIQWTGTLNTAHFVYVDNVQLEAGNKAFTVATMPPIVNGSNNRAGIAGTLLTDNASDPSISRVNAGINSFAARVGAFSPNIVKVNYGINDWYNCAAYGITAAQWRAAVKATITNIKGMSSKPQIIWTGLTTTTVTGLAVPSSGWSAYALTSTDDLKRAMNTITREECMDADVLFVPLWPDMPAAYVAADLIHPTPTLGQSFHANRVLSSVGAQ